MKQLPRRYLIAGVVAAVAVGGALATGAGALRGPVPPTNLGEQRTGLLSSLPDWLDPTALVSQVTDGSPVQFNVSLKLRDQAGAENLAKAVSDPTSSLYGKFLSTEEFLQRFGPSGDQVQQVRGWLQGAGLNVTDEAGALAVHATGTAAQLRKALGVPLGNYRIGGKMLQALGAAPSVPTSLLSTVSGVFGVGSGVRFQPMHLKTPRAPKPHAPTAQADTCSQFWGQNTQPSETPPSGYGAGNQSTAICGYTPQQMQTRYGTGGANTGAGQTVAIVGAFNLGSMLADANRYSGDHGLPALNSTSYKTVLQGGTGLQDCNPASWNGEQALDVESVHAVAPGANILYYGAKDCTTLIQWLGKAVSDNKAKIITNSWGQANESTQEERNQLDKIALEAAVKGIGVYFSSGDLGDNRFEPVNKGKASAGFPANSPYVTAVGGTTAAWDAAGNVLFETGWSVWVAQQSGQTWANLPNSQQPHLGAGGGGSLVYRQPSYQAPAVKSTGRVVPDISAIADANTGFLVGYTADGAYGESPFGGTSLAAPTIAAIVAVAQQAQKKASFGNINAWLYKARNNRQAIADITDHPSGTFNGPPSAGLPVAWYLYRNNFKWGALKAGPGYDNITGVGSPTASFITLLGK